MLGRTAAERAAAAAIFNPGIVKQGDQGEQQSAVNNFAPHPQRPADCTHCTMRLAFQHCAMRLYIHVLKIPMSLARGHERAHARSAVLTHRRQWRANPGVASPCCCAQAVLHITFAEEESCYMEKVLSVLGK